MTPPPVADQPERERLVRDLTTTHFVEAGAGTGKTTALVSRIVALVASGRLRMERLVAITFTVAAAGELRVRVREELESAAREAPGGDRAARLAGAAAEVDRAHIETIHAFCSAVLRMHPLEAGLPPDMEVAPELTAATDTRERFRRWFDSLSDAEPAGVAVRRALLLGVRPAQLLELFSTLNDNWDLMVRATWPAVSSAALAPAREVGDAVATCVALMPHCLDPDDALYRRLETVRVVGERLREAGGEEDALAALVTFERQSGGRKAGSRGNWDTVRGVNVCTRIKELMEDASRRSGAALTAARAAALSAVAVAMRDLVLAYAEERRVRGAVSYHDLLVRARDLVRDHDDVRDALRARWDFLAVDEFQDTDPLQAELAFRLSAVARGDGVPWHDLSPDAGRLCVVGDPKQSIYRFRRADIAVYAAAERRLTRAQPGARVRLSVNFRSGRRIVDAVNAVFGGDGGLMRSLHGGPDVQAPYVELVAHAPEVDGTVRIFGGPVDDRAPAMWRCEARAAAGVVRRALDEGWTVGEGAPGGARPCRPRDICLLMPSRTNLRNVERSLEEAHVAYRLESGSLIVATQEVRDLLNVMRSLDDPTDEVALVAALRSPAYGCSDTELAVWRSSGGRWSYTRPGDGAEGRVAAAMAHLRALHAARQSMSVPALVEQVVTSRLLRAAACDEWRPREAHRRYRFVAGQARALARTGRTTLHDAVAHLERLARDPSYDSVADDPADEETAIRVMTVHAAKGLEFPVVVVTGLGRRPPNRRPLVVADRVAGRVELSLGAGFTTPGWQALDARERSMEAAEQVRLLYVALTRARDHLVVGVHRARQGEETDAALLDGRLRGLDDVETIEEGPAAAAPAAPTIRTDLPAGPATPDEHREEERAWSERRAATIASMGAERLATATGLSHAGAPGAGAATTGEEVAVERRGRAATSLGRAVHAVLQLVDLRTGEGLDALAAAQSAAEGIPDRAGEVAALARSAWGSEAVRRAAAHPHWREVPVGARVDGVLLEGFVDLLYRLPDGRLVVVDHKTDSVRGAALDERLERYRVQGGAYALLVHLVTGAEVARIEFVFAAAGRTRTITDVAGAVEDARRRLAQTSP